jgi:hypothetical protein
MPTDLFDTNLLSNEIELPEDHSQWTQRISEVLFSEIPELSQFPSQLLIDKFEPVKLYAKGSYVFDVNGNKVVFPVIIKAKKLQPFDVFLLNDTWHPLDKDMLNELMMSGELGQPVEPPPEFYMSQLENQSPPSVNSRGAIMGTEKVITASVMTEDGKRELVDKLTNDDELKRRIAKNSAAKGVYTEALKAEPSSKGNLKAVLVKRASVNTAEMHTATKTGAFSKSTMPLSEAKEFIKKAFGDKAYIDFIKSGHVMLTGPVRPAFTMSELKGLIDKTAMELTSPDSVSALTQSLDKKPAVIIRIRKIDRMGGEGPHGLGAMMPGGLFKMVKSLLGMGGGCHEGFSMGDSPIESLTRDDVAMPMLSESEGVEPIKIQKVMDLPMGKVLIGAGQVSGGMFCGVLLDKYDRGKTASINEAVKLLPKGYDVTYLPSSTKFVKISGIAEAIQTKDEFLQKAAALGRRFHITVRKLGQEYHIKTANSKAIYCKDKIEAEFLLRAHGITKEAAGRYLKESEDFKPINVLFLRDPFAKTASANIAGAVDWMKIAADIDDEESVDSVLSLGFLTPENISKYYEYLPAFKTVLSKLAQMLVSLRLGNDVTNESSIKKAIEGLKDVVKELSTFTDEHATN